MQLRLQPTTTPAYVLLTLLYNKASLAEIARNIHQHTVYQHSTAKMLSYTSYIVDSNIETDSFNVIVQ